MNPYSIIETALMYDDHRNSEHPNAISTTTLIGPIYKGWASVNLEQTHKLRPMKRRSSFIGSAVHSRFELVYDEYTDIVQETFAEQYFEEEDMWVSGTFDMLVQHEGIWHLGDIKTGYGKAHTGTETTIKQLSIYRYLNRLHWTIDDEAFIWFISQSNNAYETMSVQLMSIEDTEQYIKENLKMIAQEPDFVDCNVGIKFCRCMWCQSDCLFRSEKA